MYSSPPFWSTSCPEAKVECESQGTTFCQFCCITDPFFLKMPKKLALVRWLINGSVGVMPLSASKESSKTELFVGSKTIMRWKGKKWYDVQILKISGKFCLCTYCMTSVSAT